ncbi:hypothetical protein PMO01_18605 [Pseudomonas moraviensis R28-S]|uniref:Uncharacterized protein n=1 Tax=Pseudomonas moraviensis R28-S TaxID=1395516 RepID=V8R5L4_9PSED|nr:hypothetical protein PMO01_18605 [Pseudomonas moraviensis R28-S]
MGFFVVNFFRARKYYLLCNFQLQNLVLRVVKLEFLCKLKFHHHYLCKLFLLALDLNLKQHLLCKLYSQSYEK